MRVDQVTEVGAVDTSSPPPAGDDRFTQFYTAHHPKLLRFVRRRCWVARLPMSRVDPEDIVQEVMLDALSNWSTIEKPAQWTYVVARRRVGERAEMTRRLADEDPAEPTARQTLALDDGRIGDEPFEALLVSEIRAALLALPDRQRDATVLRHIAGFSSAEIAERLGCTPATAEVHVHRGVKAVRKQLAEQELSKAFTRAESTKRRTRLKKLVTGTAVAAVACVLAWVIANRNPTSHAPHPGPGTPDSPWNLLGTYGGIFNWTLITLGGILVLLGVGAIALLLRRVDTEDDAEDR